MSAFEKLFQVNVNDRKEKKNGLSYLSWTWAYAELMKAYPDATYEIVKWGDKPYLYDKALGYMVMTRLTVEGQTKEMWLPVMDSRNLAMKAEPYTVTRRNFKADVEAATMMDINKAIMRCLVKNISLFGLGLYIYSGEDLPEGDEPEEEVKAEAKPEVKVKPEAKTSPDDKISKIHAGALLKRIGDDVKLLDYLLKSYKVATINDLNISQYEQINRTWQRWIDKVHEGESA